MNELEYIVGLPPTENYQYAQQIGNQLFVAGQVPLDQDIKLIGVGNPAAQVRQCLENLSTLIQLHGFSEHDIRQLTVYGVGDRQNLVDIWQAVTTWFNDRVPPATLLGVTCLGYDHQLVEIGATIIKENVTSQEHSYTSP
ncbi:MAG: RidA family protein [Elainellaceae cyanobacterium]